MIKIPYNTLTGLLIAAGKKDVRHYINSVFIENLGGSLACVATDGAMLACVTEDTEVPDDFASAIILRSAIEQLPRRDKHNPFVDFDPAANTLSYGGVAIQIPTCNERYPDWRKVSPTALYPATESQFNPSMLVRGQKVLAALDGRTGAAAAKFSVATSYSTGKINGAAVMRSIHTPNAYVVIMGWNERPDNSPVDVPAPRAGK